jgi:hypothetical protein
MLRKLSTWWSNSIRMSNLTRINRPETFIRQAMPQTWEQQKLLITTFNRLLMTTPTLHTTRQREAEHRQLIFRCALTPCQVHLSLARGHTLRCKWIDK